MIRKKFKFYESEKLYIPKSKSELKKLIKIPNIDFKQIDTSKIKNMSGLFKNFIFNEREMQKGGLQDISSWNVSNVRDMSYIFAWSNFNGDISDWDVSNVKNMQGMFSWSSFNGNVSKWDVSNVENMSWMFYDTPFNQDISNWDVSNVKNMKGMFERTRKFNQDISSWDVSNVKNMHKMFTYSSFNGDISKWDVSNVEDMGHMFEYSKFNQNISNWDIRNVKNMSYMFYGSEFLYVDEILKKWPKIINLNCNIEEIFSDSIIQKEFENRIKKYQKLRNL